MLPDALQMQFDSRSHPRAGERLAAWQAAMSLSVDVIVQPEHRESFAASLDSLPLGSVLLVDSRSSAQVMTRSKCTIARSGEDHIILDVVLEGRFGGRAGERRVAVGPGDVFLMDDRGILRIKLTDCRYIGVVMPRSLFEAQAGEGRDVHGLHLDAATPEAVLLGHTLRALVAQAPRLTPERAASIGVALVAMIRACVSQAQAKVVDATEPEPLPSRIRRHIERHAVDPNFDAEALGISFGLSRTALYRLCQSQGGIASLIRRRRVEIACSMLARTPEVPRGDEEIAELSGFTGMRALKRALHDLLGTTALRLRRAAAEGTVPAMRGETAEAARSAVAALSDRPADAEKSELVPPAATADVAHRRPARQLAAPRRGKPRVAPPSGGRRR